MTKQESFDNIVVENKLTAIDFNSERKTNYADLIKLLIDGRIPTEGLTMDTMRKNFHILDKLEASHSEGQIEFTKGELEIIKFNLEHSVWKIQHKDLVLFADYIVSL